MQTENPYAPPQSDLTKSVKSNDNHNQKRTLEEAIEGDYDFNIGDVISEGWQAVSGMKLNIFLGILVIVGVSWILGFISNIVVSLFSGLTIEFLFIVIFLMQLILTAVNSAVSAGFIIMILKHLRGETVAFRNDFFSFTNVFGVLFIAALLMSVLSTVGILLLIIPGIYLGIAYSFTLFIIIDHPEVSAWQAMEASRKIVTKNWFKVFGLFFVLGLILFLATMFLFIGLIWAIPLAYLTLGVVYRYMFNEVD